MQETGIKRRIQKGQKKEKEGSHTNLLTLKNDKLLAMLWPSCQENSSPGLSWTPPHHSSPAGTLSPQLHPAVIWRLDDRRGRNLPPLPLWPLSYLFGQLKWWMMPKLQTSIQLSIWIDLILWTILLLIWVSMHYTSDKKCAKNWYL